MGGVYGEHFHHPRVQALLVGVQGIPPRQSLRAHGQLGVLWHNAQLLLPFERLLTVCVLALVELAFELRDPFFGRVMGRVGGASRDIEEIGPIGRDRLGLAHP
jgi:hypothetical protein